MISQVQYDVAVVGGSLAGAAAAVLLARKGFSVRLFEPAVFPRRKVCGEGLALLGKRYLQEKGLWTPELDARARPYYGYRVVLPSNASFDITSARWSRDPYGVSIPRWELDAAVHHAAVTTPGVFSCRERVQGLLPKGTRWEIRTATAAVTCRFVVLACAAAAVDLGDRFIHSGSQQSDSSAQRFGLALWVEGRWQQKTPELVVLMQRPRGELLFTPLSDTSLNLSYFLNRPERSSGSRGRVGSKLLIDEAIETAARYGFVTERVTEVLGTPSLVPIHRRSRADGLFLVGDSAERLDPVGGMGMTHALVSGSLAAEAITEALHSQRYARDRWQEYQRLRYRHAFRFRAYTGLSRALNVHRHPVLQQLGLRSPMLASLCNAGARFVLGVGTR